MDNSNRKGNTVLLTVIAIATLLVAIVGATFAYFTAAVKGNEQASSIIINTATIGEITFKDGQEINLKDALPGTEATKNFTVSANVSNPDGVQYAISLVITKNTFDSTASDLVYSLKGTSSGDDGTVAGPADNLVLNSYQIQDSGSRTVSLGNGVLKGESASHSYRFTIRFREMGSDQNSNQGKEFNAAIQVSTSDTGDMYYTSANPGGTSEMPGSDAGISSDAE